MATFADLWNPVAQSAVSGGTDGSAAFNPAGNYNAHVFDPFGESDPTVAPSTGGNPLKITVTPNPTQGSNNSATSAAGFPDTTSGTSPDTLTGQGTGGSSAGILGLPSDWWLRAIIIILGFIFVAIGLGLFGKQQAPAILRTAMR